MRNLNLKKNAHIDIPINGHNFENLKNIIYNELKLSGVKNTKIDDDKITFKNEFWMVGNTLKPFTIADSGCVNLTKGTDSIQIDLILYYSFIWECAIFFIVSIYALFIDYRYFILISIGLIVTLISKSGLLTYGCDDFLEKLKRFLVD